MNDGSTISPSQLLTQFLFPPARQYDYIGKLSGGERRRLYLVTVLMRNPNFLILDEPTNDLDIETLNVLEDYLATAGICLLAVSHDRFFIDKISDHIFVFEGGGYIRDFPGNYTQYRSWLGDRQRLGSDQSSAAGKGGKRKTEESVNVIKDGNMPEAKGQTTDNKAITRQGQISKPKLTFNEKRELESLEKSIEALEAEKAKIETALSGGELDSGLLLEYSLKYSEVTATLEERTNRWLELSERS
jgi:ATP-binding cassette subfamily F protein uup